MNLYAIVTVLLGTLVAAHLSFLPPMLRVTAPQAAIWYVDQDQACPGNGSSGTPFCSINNAMVNSALQAGDRIHIRNTNSGIHLECNAGAASPKSGTSTAPIVIEYDPTNPPQRPYLRCTQSNHSVGVISIFDRDYWTIKGLTFDGGTTWTSRFAIFHKASSRNTFGFRVEGVTIRNWGGTERQGNQVLGIAVTAQNADNPSFRPHDVRITGNTIHAVRWSGIYLQGAVNPEVDHNDVYDIKCGVRTVNGLINRLQVAAIYIFGAVSAASAGIDGRVHHNNIHDIPGPEACGLDGENLHLYLWGIYVYKHVNRLIIDANTLSAIGAFGKGWCVEVGDGDENTITNNTCASPGGTAYINEDGSNNVWDNNSASNVTDRFTFVLYSGSDVQWTNNDMTDSRGVWVHDAAFQPGAGGHIFNFNSYNRPPGRSRIFKWGSSGSNLIDFATWKSTCAAQCPSCTCDPNSTEAP